MKVIDTLDSIDSADSIEALRQRDIVIEYQFPQPPQQVWRVLSEPELLAQWLLPNDIEAPFVEASAGRRFKLGKQFNQGKTSNPHKKEGDIECEVLACEPERLLRYSWRTGKEGGDLDSVVTFILTATEEGGTHLRLVHSGLPQATARITPMSGGKTPVVNALLTNAFFTDSLCEVKLAWAA